MANTRPAKSLWRTVCFTSGKFIEKRLLKYNLVVFLMELLNAPDMVLQDSTQRVGTINPMRVNGFNIRKIFLNVFSNSAPDRQKAIFCLPFS
jgi:hypothetical protein